MAGCLDVLIPGPSEVSEKEKVCCLLTRAGNEGPQSFHEGILLLLKAPVKTLCKMGNNLLTGTGGLVSIVS